MTAEQLQTIREDFPILGETMRNKPFIYLDSGATSLKPRSVIQAMEDYYTGYGVNIHRGVYEFSERATREYHEARVKTARFIGALRDGQPYGSGPGHVIFTKSTTEGANLIAYSWGRTNLTEGDEIITTEIEHHSTLVPWHPVVGETGARLRFVPMTGTGEFDFTAFQGMVSSKTKAVIITAMSNVTGYMPPVEDIIKTAHQAGAVVIIDGAQFVSHHPVDVQAWDVDFLYFSAHKMLGPTGLGVLYAKTELLEAMPPFLYGGDMILQVHKDYSTYHPLPEKFEAGTPHIAGVLGFSAALDYLEGVGMEHIHQHESELIAYTLEVSKTLPWITVYGPEDPSLRGGIFSFNLEGMHSHDVGALLDAQGIAVRTGFHCAQPFMEQMGISGTVRASYYLYNEKQEIDALFAGLEKARALFL